MDKLPKVLSIAALDHKPCSGFEMRSAYFDSSLSEAEMAQWFEVGGNYTGMSTLNMMKITPPQWLLNLITQLMQLKN